MPDSRITDVAIRMYRLGTGDCFVLKFMKDDEVRFKMLIDCGCWGGAYSKVRPFVQRLKQDVDKEVDVLVVTHEHKDHVYGFEAAKALFTNDFDIKQIWMGWTENDADGKVATWKEKYGDKKKALALAARQLSAAVRSRSLRRQFQGSRDGDRMFAMRRRFASVLNDFVELHLSLDENMGVDEVYKGALKGMKVVKDDIGKNRICYYNPGDVIENVPGLEGVRIFVLGPPELYKEVKKETGKEGEAYKHNRDIEEGELFIRALHSNDGDHTPTADLPFSARYTMDKTSRAKADKEYFARYEKRDAEWRRIDHEWLQASGDLALRMNHLTNNLSLVLAIEFVEEQKVLLFPGDAEFGSWESWHDVAFDAEHKTGESVTASSLLKRTVFYKVAHHLSHNGTARGIGLDLMESRDLVAMATLDYKNISPGWKSTMPNRLLLKDLLEKTRGRLLIMNETDLYYDLEGQIPLTDKIAEYNGRLTDPEREAFTEATKASMSKFVEYNLKV